MVRTLLTLLLVFATGPTASTAQETNPDPNAGEVLVVGDSLAVGVEGYLDEFLDPRPVRYAVKSGIGSPQGVRFLKDALVEEITPPSAVVISLGTNDGSNWKQFAMRVRQVLKLTPPTACVVWPALHRAPRKGAFRKLNAALRKEAMRNKRLKVVGWDKMVDQKRVALPDGVHPDDLGYQRRASVIARTVSKSCPINGGGFEAPSTPAAPAGSG